MTLSERIEAESEWFADREGRKFWGTSKQLTHCAKCGEVEFKRHDEPRHLGHKFKPTMHYVCDACFDGLPDDDTAFALAAAAIRAREGGE